jgi:hypothetical protein
MKAVPWLLLLSSIGLAAAVSSCVVDNGCTSADNYCSDPWFLNYCDDATGNMYGTDCQDSCTHDERVYGAVCGGSPAASGECNDVDGVCTCWCEDAFDSCVDQDTVSYTRGGVNYQLSCSDYCGGTCDAGLGACACP